MSIRENNQHRTGMGSPAFPGGINDRHTLMPRTGDSWPQIWDTVLGIPGVRSWRFMRDIAFLLTSLPVGLAAFILLITGGTVGFSLIWLLIGFPILIWTVGLTLRLAASERDRLHRLLDLDLASPRYPRDNGENVIKHMWSVARSPQVRGELLYMALLFPIGIAEFALVFAPLEFFVPSLLHLVFGSTVSFDVFGVALGSRPEALLFMVLGVVLLVPILMLMNVVTSIHARFARTLLDRR